MRAFQCCMWKCGPNLTGLHMQSVLQSLARALPWFLLDPARYILGEVGGQDAYSRNASRRSFGT